MANAPTVDITAAEEAVAETIESRFKFNVYGVTFRQGTLRAEDKVSAKGNRYCSVSFTLKHLERDQYGNLLYNEKGYELATYVYGGLRIFPDNRDPKGMEKYEKAIKPFLDANGMMVTLAFSNIKDTSHVNEKTGKFVYSFDCDCLDILSIIPMLGTMLEDLQEASLDVKPATAAPAPAPAPTNALAPATPAARSNMPVQKLPAAAAPAATVAVADDDDDDHPY